MNKSLNLDILVSPEIGSGIFLFGLTLILYGYRQSKKDFDLDSLPIINPRTKVIFGCFFVLFGCSDCVFHPISVCFRFGSHFVCVPILLLFHFLF